MDQDKQKKPPHHKSETSMREKTVQAAAGAEKVSRRKRLGRVLAKPFRPIGKVLARIERFKPIHIIGLVIIPRYLRNAWKELRLVTWPSRRETRRLTGAVLVFAVIFGVLIAAVDYGLDKVFKKVILKQ